MTSADQSKELNLLLDYLKNTRGFDFGGYKRTSLVRRIQKRIQATGNLGYAEYIDYLEVHPDEFELLFNTILINVTGFFRDSQAWKYINEQVIPRIIADKKAGQPIRIWSAGCSSGEEAFTVAMLFAEHLGIEQFKERVKIYATDIDLDSLTKARLAVYPKSELDDIPPDLLEKYFDTNGSHYFFNKELRRSVIFGRHDLIQDAPISRIDLLVCRNILMYFNSDTQSKIIARLNYSLNDHAFIFLGKAEMLLTHVNFFIPVDLKNRIFTKAASINIRDRLLVMAHNGGDETHNPMFGHIRVRDAAFEGGVVAQLIVDPNGYLALINEKARSLFNISTRDVGRPFRDLEISYRPVELRSEIEKAYEKKTSIILRDIEYFVPSASRCVLDVQLTPLMHNQNFLVGMIITFHDVTEQKRLQLQIEQANQELETAMEELQSTNEELETTNEELQSTIEELETTNEELQSTNEELETMNEELQSTNEELETVNDEMAQRSIDLNRLNNFLETILTSLRGGVIVMNSDQIVQIWNRKSEDMWGLRPEEVIGHNFFGLDSGLPVEQLKKPIRSILSGEQTTIELQLPATNRRGRSIICDTVCAPLIDNSANIQGVIIIMEQKNIPGE